MDAQKKIEEMIRQEAVLENMEHAMEYSVRFRFRFATIRKEPTIEPSLSCSQRVSAMCTCSVSKARPMCSCTVDADLRCPDRQISMSK